MMSSLNWIVLPIVLPAFAAPILILMRLRRDAQAIVSTASTFALLALCIGLFVWASDGTVRPYLLGDWPAPFGIVLVLDRLSATMILLNAVLACAVIVYAVATGWDDRGHHFHTLFQFQLMGINGAFLTGDLFNLFVFFEVMLIASYGLMLHGGGPRRLGAGFNYVAVNLVGSTLFLFAVGLIYGVTGTLNMADLARKVADVGAGDAALLRTGALLLFLVFAIKASLMPLHWWLPMTYSAAPAPVAALFAILTKVGAYSIIRVFTLIFGAEAGLAAGIATPWILPAALLTLAVGAVGALAARRFVDLVCFAIVWSMGSLLVALAFPDVKGLTAALYYALHSTLIGGALFLLADVIATGRGPSRDRLVAAPSIARASTIGLIFFAAAIAMAGLPPFSGFIGKVLILDATRGAPSTVWIWGLILGTSLILVLAFARAGSLFFWKSEEINEDGAILPAPSVNRVAIAAAAALVCATVLLSIFARPVTGAVEATARQILDPGAYARAVLGPPTLKLSERR